MDFLPYYYREADTYKVNGKGILERYLEIFGNYFEDYIVKDTKNILDILDIDNCPEIYLNYLWEFLGQMPFAYGSNIDAEKWKAYFNGFASDEEMAELSKLWIIPKTPGNFRLSPDKVRRFLKYSISLFKIRGTQRFFEILFKMYGLNCEIGYPQSDSLIDINGNYSSDYYGSDEDFAGSDCQSNDDNGDYAGREMYISRYVDTKADIEDNILDECPLDKRSTCTKCITLPVTITGHSFDSEDIPEETFVQFQKICEAIFDRFLPFNVQADINYGFDIPCTYHISTYLKEGDEWLFLASDTESDSENLSKLYLQDTLRKELQIKVLVSRSYRNREDLTFKVGSISQVESDETHTPAICGQAICGQTICGETPTILTLGEADHTSGFIVRITRALENADYLFRSTKPNSDGTYTSVSLSVTRNVIVKEYNLSYQVWDIDTNQPASSSSTEINPENLFIYVRLSGSVNINGSTHTDLAIRDLNTGHIYTKDPENPNAPIIVSFNKPGTYKYALVDYPLKQIEIVVTRVPEKLFIIKNPDNVKEVINFVGELAYATIYVNGIYDLNDYDRWVACIQAKDEEGNFVDINNYKVDTLHNKIYTYDYGDGDVALLDEEVDSKKPIKLIRICCIKDVIRNTSQYLQIHKRYFNDNDEEIHEYVNLWGNLRFRKGRIHIDVREDLEYEVYDPDWLISDWIDISEYQRGFTQESTPKPISRLEFHLICSKFRYYEVGNRTQEYNNGEIFKTSSPGKYIFKPVLLEDTLFEQDPITLNITSTVNSQVKYGININPQIIQYQPVTGQTYSKAANTVIRVTTDLTYSEGVNLDNIYPLNFKVYIYTKSDLETPLRVISESDPNWHVNLQSSKYEKYISVQFTDAEFTPQGSGYDGEYVIQLDSGNIIPGGSRNKTLTIIDYVDPNKDHLILVPYASYDPGWNGKNWNEDNKKATWYPTTAQYASNFVKVKIEGTDGSMSGYNTVKVYKVVGDTETLLSQTFTVDTFPTNINNGENGTYRFRVSNGIDEKPEYVQLVISGSGATFSIQCTPTEASQSIFSGVNVEVNASVNMSVPDSQLYVRRIDESTWYPSGHIFNIPSPGSAFDQVYTFQVKGDLSKTCNFTYKGLNPNT